VRTNKKAVALLGSSVKRDFRIVERLECKLTAMDDARIDCSASPLPNGDVLYYGRARMIVIGASTRIAFFRTPGLKTTPYEEDGARSTPVILASIDGIQIGSTQSMVVYGVSIQSEGPYTYFDINAQTAEGIEVSDEALYWCNVTIIGTPGGSPRSN
jgi:hypothetical protein